MTPEQFIAKWQLSQLTERSAAQQHFLDLCELLGQPKPADVDQDGSFYTFERGVHKLGGGKGWADVWFKDKFGWEYKGKHKDLADAYAQLCRYREDLDNPPLLVVCDMDRFQVHTNFTATAKKVYEFSLDSLAEPANLDVLRKCFTEPEALRPAKTIEKITEEIAAEFSKLADGMRKRKIEPERAAHFLMKLMFCMFAEDIGLLEGKLFARILAGAKTDPPGLARRMKALFEAMATGGEFGADPIEHFNGGLFADADVIELTAIEIRQVIAANNCDWSSVQPSIFGTLFERTLDPAKRSQIGAHYTSEADIRTLLEPVMMTPLRRRWEEVRSKGAETYAKLQEAVRGGKGSKSAKSYRQAFDKLLLDFIGELEHVRVLDPACGSGNFLYVAIKLLLDLEKEVITYGANHDSSLTPHVSPRQLAGIEINPYAHELAQVVIWIGYLQWKLQNGYNPPRKPILEPINNIKHMDAILDLSDPDNPKEPRWPEADFIVGNPPFLGDKKLRSELGQEYVDKLFESYSDAIPHQSDICCYWFEKARRQIELGWCKRAGLLATQGIRGGASRQTLKRIKKTGGIFWAESDRPWILEGANVHVSMVGFDKGAEQAIVLDGNSVASINANLGTSSDITQAVPLAANTGLSFQGPVKVGSFEIEDQPAQSYLASPNPSGKCTSDVIRPWTNGIAITQGSDPMWIIDFEEMPLDEASKYDKAFEHVRKHVKPERDKTRRDRRRKLWWIHGEVNNALRQATLNIQRYIATCQTAKHRMFVWLDAVVLPAQTVIAFARHDDYFFGILHSRPHEIWGLKLGTRLETRPRYTPTTCFETFPFPTPTDAQREAIAAAAKELDELRNRWLNPPEWTKQEVLEFPGSTSGPWARYVHNPDLHGIGTVRYPRTVAKDEDSAELLSKRTLTKLYNERPTWLALAHDKLDAAVFAAYGWEPPLSDDDLLARLLALNLERAGGGNP